MNDSSRLADFLTHSITAYHFVEYARPLLLSHGYTEIKEGKFPREFNNRAFWVRDGRTLIAYDSSEAFDSAVIVAAHDDSPHIKLKNRMNTSVDCVELADAGLYAGGLSYSWYGRDLKVGGCIVYKENENIMMKIVQTDKAIATIPFPSVSLNPDENSGLIFETNRNVNLNLMVGIKGTSTVLKYLCDIYGLDIDNVLSYNLEFVDSRPATVNGDMVISGRLDDLASAYGVLYGFLNSKANNTLNVLAVYDNEEIGSRTRTGALGNSLDITLRYICNSKNVDYLKLKSKTFFANCDAAHSQHPNYEQIGECKHQLPVGSGVGIKTATKISYAFDDFGYYFMQEVAKRANVPYKLLIGKNGPSGGGTIGPKIEKSLGISVTDIGPGNYSMHSCREMMSWKDAEAQVKLISYLLNNYKELREYVYNEIEKQK